MSTVKGKPRYGDNTHMHLFQVETTGRLRYISHVGTPEERIRTIAPILSKNIVDHVSLDF